MTASSPNTVLRSIPAMDELLAAPWSVDFANALGREAVKKIITQALDGLKRDVLAGARLERPCGEEAVFRARSLLGARAGSSLERVVNATGVVIHTNLGRAPLAGEALHAAGAIGGAYSTLEYSLHTGERGGRNAHIEWLVCQMTGAEAALAVNNNAAAVLLALAALAAGREVVVSCGELVEIGGSFRIPEILKFSGAKMVAVGCTNATRISDYRDALNENTAVLLKVHPSNYRVDGFVTSTSREELAGLAAARGLVFIEDVGSGLLHRLNVSFAHREHSVRDCVKALRGDSVITFSGDKLLGGPQIGIIAGSRRLIDLMSRHQLLRALRVDKMTLAAFEATLRLYLAGRHNEIPVISMIERDKSELRTHAQALCRLLADAVAGAPAALARELRIEVVETEDAVGGGAYPTDTLPGWGVALRSALQGADKLAACLRAAPVPVIPAIHDNAVILHARTLLSGDDAAIATAVRTFAP